MHHAEFVTWKIVPPYRGAQKPQKWAQEQQISITEIWLQQGHSAQQDAQNVGYQNSCFPLSFERHKFHKAPQEEISPKTPECRSGFQYYRAFGIKMVNVGLGAINICENWLWFLNVLNRTQDKVDWFGCISGKTKQNKKRTSGSYGDSSIIHCLCLPSSNPWVQLSLTNTHTISLSFSISLRWQEKPSIAAVIC